MLKTKISIKNFFIFNSSFCSREGEEENKILFYHPDTTEKNDKLKDVGFIEAIIKFTGSFTFEETTPKDVHCMKTTKTMKFFYEPEKDFCIVLTINVPFERKEKDKKEYIEYYSDDAHEVVFKRIVQRAYLHFRFFNNTFLSNMSGESLEEKLTCVRGILESFFTKYLLTMNLQNADIIDGIECIQYKPVSHLIFFRVINFLNMVTSIKNLKIKKCVFLYNQEIVYSALSPMDLYTIHEYLNTTMFPKFLYHRNSQSFDIDRSVGCFITELEINSIPQAPKIFIRQNGNYGTLEAYRLVVYTILDVSLVMLVEDGEGILGDEFCNEIKYSIGPQLGIISKEMTENFQIFEQNIASKVVNDDNAHAKYIYFNHHNKRFHACFYDNDSSMNHREGRKLQISSSVINLLCDLYAKDDEDYKEHKLILSEKETIIKTYDDYWIVGRAFNNRSVYLILHKTSTLIDIAEESQRLLTEIAKNVYFTNQL